MPKTKLTDADVIFIRQNIDVMPTADLAERFNVTGQTIRNAARGRIPAYADTKPDAPPAQPSGKHVGTDEQRKRIMELSEEGMTQTDIAKTLGLSLPLVNLVIHGKR